MLYLMNKYAYVCRLICNGTLFFQHIYKKIVRDYSLFGNTFHWKLIAYRNQSVALKFILLEGIIKQTLIEYNQLDGPFH